MQIFQDFDDKTFIYNNRRYVKNFIVLKVGSTNISVINAYDSKVVLLSSTHYSQVELDGTVYESQQALMNALSPITFSKASGAESIVSNQNNLGRYLQFGYLQGTGAISPLEVSNWINAQNFGLFIGETTTPVLLEFLRTEDGKTNKYIFLFTRGKGNWGTAAGTPVQTGNFRLLSVQLLTTSDVEEDENSQINDLGEVPDGNFIDVANQSEWNFSTTGTSYYFSYTVDEVLFFALFVGEAGNYGGGLGNDDFTEADFIATTNSQVQPIVIPNLQQVLNEGSVVTGSSISLIDGNDKLELFSGGLSFEKNTFNTQVTFEDPIDDVFLSIPAKPFSDTFAMMSDLDNIDLAGYVPFNGASQSLNMGSNSIQINDLFTGQPKILLDSFEGLKVYDNSNNKIFSTSGFGISFTDPANSRITNLYPTNNTGVYSLTLPAENNAILATRTYVNNAVSAATSGGTSFTGTTSQYVRGNGTYSTFATDVRNTTLSGLTEGTSSIVSTDTIVQAIGKAQGQISNILNQVYARSSENTVNIQKIAFVNALPVSPDASTSYFIQSSGATYQGSISLSANGTTTISIPHSSSGTPLYVNVQAKNSGAAGISYVTASSTQINIHYNSAPTGMLEYWYKFSNE